MDSVIDEIEKCIPELRRIKNARDSERAKIRQDVGSWLLKLGSDFDQIDTDAIVKRIDSEDVYVKILVLSWLHHMSSDTVFMEQIVEEALASSLDPDERWHLYYQVAGLFFNNSDFPLTERLEEFLSMVKPCMEKGVFLLILGDVSRKEDEFKRFLGDVSDRLIMPGAVDDPLAYMENCYLYINPNRMGEFEKRMLEDEHEVG